MDNTIVNESLVHAPKYALLVDGDNIPADHAKTIMENASAFGMLTTLKVYGNWTENNLSKWKDIASKYALTICPVMANVSRKNATDFVLVIEAMDILHRENVDGFILVSSDSDYTALAKRLRESGKVVVGMGKSPTPSAFKNACMSFILLDQDESGKDKVKPVQVKNDKSGQTDAELPEIDEIKATIDHVLRDNDSKDSLMIVSALADKLKTLYPEFGPKKYHKGNMSKLLQDLGFEVVSKNSNKYVVCPTKGPVKKSSAKSQVLTDNQLKKEINAILDKAVHSDRVIVSAIKDDLVKMFPSFKIKDYECKKMTDLLKKLGFELVSDESNKYVVRK